MFRLVLDIPEGASLAEFSMESIEGAIDSLTRWGATGWAWMPGVPDQVVEVEAVLDGRVIGRALADQMRADLAEKGKGTGRYGFVLTFVEDVAVKTHPSATPSSNLTRS